MAQGKSPVMSITNLTDEIRKGDWPAARRAMAIRLGEAFDQTDSARDLKAISMTLVPLIAECEKDEERSEMDKQETAYSSIIAEAERLINAR